MPKAKQKSPRISNEADDDSGPSATQAERKAASLSNDEKERKVLDIVRYMLVADQKKIPIKRTDINKNVLKEHSAAFQPLMEIAKRKLADIFGLDLVELDGKQKSYILVNKYEPEEKTMHLAYNTFENQCMGLLMVILSTIFMNNNNIVDDKLYSMLKRLGVDIEKPHPVFGDPKKLITQEFVRQGYLEMTRQPNSDPAIFDFTWGQRSLHEVSKRKCLDFVSRIYNMDDSSGWTSQSKDVQNSERHQRRATSQSS